jgi:hypothetical protein
MEKYTVEKLAETRSLYTFKRKCRDGGKLLVDVCKCIPDNTSANSLPILWKKHAYTSSVLSSYWSIIVYAYDKNGNCWGKYNPQIIPNANKINFDWMLEATDENLKKLLDEVERLAFYNRRKAV